MKTIAQSRVRELSRMQPRDRKKSFCTPAQAAYAYARRVPLAGIEAAGGAAK